MDKVSEVLVLLLICVLLIIGMGIYELTTITISIGIVLVALSVIREKKIFRIVLYVISLVIGYFFPELLFFSLIISVIIIEKEDMASLSSLAFPFVVILINRKFSYLFQLLLFLIITVGFGYINYKYKNLKETYENSLDESRINQLDLLATNKYLTENQNRGITIAILEERNRIARDIHDGVGHLISRGILQLGAIIVTEHDEDKKNSLMGIKDSLGNSMEELRKSVHNIVEMDSNLETMIKNAVDEFTFCELKYKYELKYAGNMNFNYSILFIIQESLNNIMVHSNATIAEISLMETKDNIFLLIKDNGTDSQINKLGIGLASIRERVNSMNGNIEISTDNGFRIFVSLRKDKI